ncbi:MAG: hypothetical protein ABJF04_00615 [Reichenbachiella sp.]|uniref:hypothetical protein n=1 Tax=Reichenbachiella sp. TaxID=2184521 RepID=UPI0032678FE5
MNTPSYSQKFETSILRVASIIGVVRMLIAVARDLTVDYHPVDFVMDLSLLAIISIPLILTFTRVALRYYLIPFCFLVTLALPVSWISSGGLDSNNEYQMIGAIFLFTMILSGRWLIFFTSLMIVMEVILIYIWNNHHALIAGLTKEPSMQRIHFVLMAVACTVAFLYLKEKLSAKRKQLNEQSELLSTKLNILAERTAHITAQKKEIEEINRQLEQKVEIRSEELKRQNKSLSQFIDLGLRDIHAPLHSILDDITEITHLEQDYELVRLLADSGVELEQSVKKIASNLEDDVIKLNRNQP